MRAIRLLGDNDLVAEAYPWLTASRSSIFINRDDKRL